MYKHPEINYQPQHPTLQNFEPTGVNWNFWKKSKKKQPTLKEKKLAWMKLVKKLERMKPIEHVELVNMLREYADKYYKNDNGTYRMGGANVDFEPTWRMFAEHKLNKGGPELDMPPRE